VRHLALANLRAKPVRFLATLLAIVVGTGFLAGTMVLSDSLGPAVKSNALIALHGVDAAVEPALQTSTLRAGRNRTLSGASVPASVLDQVRQIPEVATAAGNLTASLDVLQGRTQVLKGITGSLLVPYPALSAYQFVHGRAPTRSGEISLDSLTSGRRHWGIGTHLELATASGPKPVTVVGITHYGTAPASSASGDIVVNPQDAFTFLASGAHAYDSIYATARQGTTEQQLVDALTARLGTTRFDIQTGDQLRTNAAGQVADIASVLGVVLQVFAYVALFVGIFIIYNTFSIVVTQRLREFALLRAVGAQGSQLGWAVVIEAAVVGVVASALGMLAGIGLFLLFGKAVPVVADLVGTGGITLHVHLERVIEVLLVGTIVTVVSAAIPALRAGRTRPLAALRTAAVDRSGTNRGRAFVGLAAIGLGALLLLLGMATHAGLISGLMIGAGPLLLFIGVLIGGPVLANGFATGVGWVLARFGTSSRLAAANSKRNPGRTASTANALIIGMFLVVFVTAAGGALRDWIVAQADQLPGADLSVAASTGGIPSHLQQQIRTTPGIASTAPIYAGIGEVSGAAGPGPGAEGPAGRRVSAGNFQQVAKVVGLKNQEGDVASLRDDQIAVSTGRRGRSAIPLGAPVDVTFKNGVTRTFTVGAVLKPSFDLLGYLVSSRAALAADPQLLVNQMSVDVHSGQVDAVQTRLEDLTAGYSTISVVPGNFIAQFVKSAFNFIISSVNALLGFAIAMAVFGIVNTLVLSVTERTPEIGLLRSVGMTRRQLRTSIRAESVILAADGTFVGMAFGLFVAWAVTQPLFTGSESFSWPWREMGIIALIGLAIGMVASLVPAWRAARIDVLDAIATE
jgi:putative ABC transport system permease protein